MNIQEKKIFIVDDDRFASELYKEHLTHSGFLNVSTFLDGVSALDQLVEEPAIVFLDYQMDVLNGFELLNKIKRFNPNIIAVMISGQDDMNVAIESLKYGAFDYVVKGENEFKKIDAVLKRIDFYFHELEKNRPSIIKSIRSIFQ